jgi:putative spermidine/putrescine transport system permease protein
MARASRLGPSHHGPVAEAAAPATAPAPAPASGRRRLAGGLHRRPRLRLGLLLAGPVGWLVIAYLGSLLILFINAFWSRDAFTGLVIRQFTLDNFVALVENPLYRTVTLRTVLMAAAVTVTCAIIAFPIAYYMARVASPRTRGLLVVAVLMPLWASYLIKAYTWRLILAEDGVMNWFLAPFGLKGPGYGEVGLWLVFVYLWLPYMILPLFAGLERIPSSVLDASSDLGAKGLMTFRRVTLPLVVPALVAGSIFTFSLTLGDYIAPSLITTTQFIGNLILANFGVPDLPFAAALSLVPLTIMIVYLMLARRLGAFEAL